MEDIIKSNNEMLKVALENIKPIKKRLEEELLVNYLKYRRYAQKYYHSFLLNS